MQPGLTIHGAIALFGVMAVLAFVPSMSVLGVSARAATSGFIHGLFMTAGIVTGDVVYVLIAVLGLSYLTEAMSGGFELIRYAGGAYLIWLSVNLWRSTCAPGASGTDGMHSRRSSFLSGLAITLADYKVILFYLGFFPAFVNISAITPIDTLVIIAITVVAVGGPKLYYVRLGDRARHTVKPAWRAGINRLAGLTLAVVGAFLIVGPLIS